MRGYSGNAKLVRTLWDGNPRRHVARSTDRRDKRRWAGRYLGGQDKRTALSAERCRSPHRRDLATRKSPGAALPLGSRSSEGSASELALAEYRQRDAEGLWRGCDGGLARCQLI